MPPGDWGTDHLGYFLYENWIQHNNRLLQRDNPELWASYVEELNLATLKSLEIQAIPDRAREALDRARGFLTVEEAMGLVASAEQGE